MNARIVTIGGVTYGYVGIAPPFSRRSEVAFRLEAGRWVASHTVHDLDTDRPRCRTIREGYQPDSATVGVLDRAYVERLAEDAA